MPNRTKYWLDWKNKLIKPNNPNLQEIPWAEIENFPLTVFCDQNTWPLIEIEEKEKKLITNEAQRTYQIGLATIKELRGSSEENSDSLGTQALKKCWELCPDFISEHPSHSKEIFKAISGWVFPPRFENLQTGTFAQVWKIDLKSCHGKIMREYPLPYGEPLHLQDPVEIEKALQEGKHGFVRFYLKNGAKIKNQQIPFIPNYSNKIETEIKGRLLLYTRLFQTFKKQYQILKPLIFTDFWVFAEKKGCVDKFLDYCEQLKETEQKQGKLLTNAFYGAVGKGSRKGYNYRAWTLAINHLAILQTYYLYRQFKPSQVLAIRSDCIYIQGELPLALLKDKNKYHFQKINKIALQGANTIFNYDQLELKSFTAHPAEREKLIKKFKEEN